MYDELVKRLRDIARSDGNIKSNYIGLSLLQAADAIEDLEFACNRYEKDYKALCEYLPKWIPVAERLPEAWEEVMLQFPNNQAAGFFDGDCGWGVFSGDDFYTYVAPEEVHPTHWAKKLPEPPKEET